MATRPDVEAIRDRVPRLSLMTTAPGNQIVILTQPERDELCAYVEELEAALARFARKYEPVLNAADRAELRALPIDPQGFPLPYDRTPQ